MSACQNGHTFFGFAKEEYIHMYLYIQHFVPGIAVCIIKLFATYTIFAMTICISSIYIFSSKSNLRSIDLQLVK